LTEEKNLETGNSGGTNVNNNGTNENNSGTN